MQRTHPLVVRVILFMLLMAPSIRAEVTAVSLNQYASSSVGPGFFGTPPDSDQLTNTAFAPVTLEVQSVGGESSDRTTSVAGIIITSYSGPMGVGESTLGLSISGSTYRGSSGPLSASSGAGMTLFFDLDQSQAFTFNGTGTPTGQQLYFGRVGSGTTIAPGSSGLLVPGRYELTAGHNPSSFNLVITPEPGFLPLVGLTSLLALRRRARCGR